MVQKKLREGTHLADEFIKSDERLEISECHPSLVLSQDQPAGMERKGKKGKGMKGKRPSLGECKQVLGGENHSEIGSGWLE
jgi:hypothetical protein